MHHSVMSKLSLINWLRVRIENMYVLCVVFSSVDEDVQLKLLYVSCCTSDGNTEIVHGTHINMRTAFATKNNMILKRCLPVTLAFNHYLQCQV